MASTFISMNIHCVFSTKDRQKIIDKEIMNRLYSYMGGIARQNNMVAQAVGGTSDHIHLLLSIPATINLAKAVQLIKAGSSKWIHDEFPDRSGFGWQTGYSAFSVSVGKLHDIILYINNQEEQHKRRTFDEEYIDFLKKSGIEYDDRYVFG
jgi:putative transposase